MSIVNKWEQRLVERDARENVRRWGIDWRRAWKKIGEVHLSRALETMKPGTRAHRRLLARIDPH